MVFRKGIARSLLRFLVLLTAAMALVVTIALAGERSNVPTRYRYAGVVENARGAPSHNIAMGDGFQFVFFDSLRQGLRSEPYRLCLGPAGKPAIQCWRRTARYGLGRVAFPATLPPKVAFGPLTARWLIGGRTVATWPFLYVRSGA
jgi:hypothetical protein